MKLLHLKVVWARHFPPANRGVLASKGRRMPDVRHGSARPTSGLTPPIADPWWPVLVSRIWLVILFGVGAGGEPSRCRGEEGSGTVDWAFSGAGWRVPVTIHAGLYSRQDCVVRWTVDFAKLVKSSGMKGVVDNESFRVAEAETQHEAACVFTATEGAVTGELRWTMAGQINALEVRKYWVYFNLQEVSMGTLNERAVVKALFVEDVVTLSSGAATNWVRNPGFELSDPKQPTAPSEWLSEVYAGCESRVTVVSGPVHTGGGALRIECVRGMVARVRQNRIPMKPNSLYRIGCWVQADPGNTNRLMVVRLYAFPVNADLGSVTNASAATIDSGPLGLSPGGGWLRLGKRGAGPISLRTPPDTAYCVIRIEILGDTTRDISPVGTIYVDDVEMVEVQSGDLPAPVVLEAGMVEE